MLKAKGQSFMRIDGAHGNGKQYSSCKAKDRYPSNGTDDYKKSVEMMAQAWSMQIEARERMFEWWNESKVGDDNVSPS